LKRLFFYFLIIFKSLTLKAGFDDFAPLKKGQEGQLSSPKTDEKDHPRFEEGKKSALAGLKRPRMSPTLEEMEEEGVASLKRMMAAPMKEEKGVIIERLSKDASVKQEICKLVEKAEDFLAEVNEANEDSLNKIISNYLAENPHLEPWAKDISFDNLQKLRDRLPDTLEYKIVKSYLLHLKVDKERLKRAQEILQTTIISLERGRFESEIDDPFIHIDEHLSPSDSLKKLKLIEAVLAKERGILIDLLDKLKGVKLQSHMAKVDRQYEALLEEFNSLKASIPYNFAYFYRLRLITIYLHEFKIASLDRDRLTLLNKVEKEWKTLFKDLGPIEEEAIFNSDLKFLSEIYQKIIYSYAHLTAYHAAFKEGATNGLSIFSSATSYYDQYWAFKGLFCHIIPSHDKSLENFKKDLVSIRDALPSLSTVQIRDKTIPIVSIKEVQDFLSKYKTVSDVPNK
jgi:hypothetical protein